MGGGVDVHLHLEALSPPYISTMTYYATNTIHYWHKACIKCNMYDIPYMTFLTCVPIILLSSVYASQWRSNFGCYSEKTCRAALRILHLTLHSSQLSCRETNALIFVKQYSNPLLNNLHLSNELRELILWSYNNFDFFLKTIKQKMTNCVDDWHRIHRSI